MAGKKFAEAAKLINREQLYPYTEAMALAKKTNVAKTAVARELACFMWGMVTGNAS